jgi:hypothetical protein
MHPEVKRFAGSWNFIRGMTKEFARGVPAGAWEVSPLPEVSPMAKQIRHLICVSGTYTRALETRRMEMAGKHEFYTGGLGQAELLAALERCDLELLEVLNGIDESMVLEEKIDFFGGEMSFSEFTHVMIQHESIHQGLWAAYARAGKFKTPESWTKNWKL